MERELERERQENGEIDGERAKYKNKGAKRETEDTW